jgi:hypothetical protein
MLPVLCITFEIYTQIITPWEGDAEENPLKKWKNFVFYYL